MHIFDQAGKLARRKASIHFGLTVRQALLVVGIACLVTGNSAADPLHAIAEGAFWHHDSGWIFPEKVGEFVRVGVPQDIAGSKDAVAHYARVVGSDRMTASVDVYPSDSATGDVTFTTAKSTLERELESSNPQLHNEGELKIDSLVAATASYEAKARANDGYVSLYFVDTGDWLVKIRVTSPGMKADAQLLETFVREQRWDSLAAPITATPTPR